MSKAIKFERHQIESIKSKEENSTKGRVKLADLLSRLKADKKKERTNNIILSIAAISAVTVFGIILSI